MRRRVLLVLASVLVAVAALSAFVLVPSGLDFLAARKSVDGGVRALDRSGVVSARNRLQRAADRLDSLPAHLLAPVPLVGANVRAMERSASALVPVLDAGLAVDDALRDIEAEGFVRAGAFRPALLSGLRAPLERLSASLGELDEAIGSVRSGWLAPPVWDALTHARQRARDLASQTAHLRRLIDVFGALAGEDDPRRYLVMLINNAELRGGGGVLSGVGSLSVRDGRFRLGRLYPVEDLRVEPPVSVPAPPDYERRFGRYLANTTLWLNTTFSPDVPDDALVASRLFQAVTGVRTEGAIVIDPRGLAALMPEDATVGAPGTGRLLTPEDFASFVYSDAYAEFRDQRARKEALLALGRRAFSAILEGGLRDQDALVRAGEAMAGGHLRFVSFRPAEEDVLDALGATGALPPVVHDDVLVTVQNFGAGRRYQGTKLDYWVRRSLSHDCVVGADGAATCSTGVTLRNRVPRGLTRYVVGTPYGLVRSYVEVYVPAGAKGISATHDGAVVSPDREEQDGRTALGVYVEVSPGSSTTIEAAYRLAPRAGVTAYDLTIAPQALTEDARLEITLRLPEDWDTEGPELARHDDGTLGWTGPLDRTYRLRAAPDGRSGLPAFWDDLTDLIRRRLF